MNLKSGILLLDKPKDFTSFDCIGKLRKIYNRKDLGHAGTLDRFATGLLPVLFGEALKLSRFFQEPYPKLASFWKSYSGIAVIGVETDTLDPSGEVTQSKTLSISEITANWSKPEIQAIMQTFVGCDYHQVPPQFSAKKIQGKRASDRTRDGEAVELKPSLVFLKSFNCLEVTTTDEGKLLVSFTVECSKGTYIRSLVRDLAFKKDQVAHLKELRRTSVGNYLISEAQTFEEVEKNPSAQLISLSEACSFLPKVLLLPDQLLSFKKGNFSGLLQSVAKSKLEANAYCVWHEDEPMALIEVFHDSHAEILRVFSQ